MFQLVLSTCPDIASAKVIAKALVAEKLAACVNIIPNVTSIYRWQENIECETEVQLLIKSQHESFNALAERIKNLHAYEVPEIIALNIQQGEKHYFHWITDSMK